MNLLILGAGGFLGKHVWEAANKTEHKAIVYAYIDLCHPDSLPAVFDTVGPVDAVLNVVGRNGGLKYNLENRATIFHQNTLMSLNTLEACKEAGVKKVVSVVASCAYPELQYGDNGNQYHLEVLEERDFLHGEPHHSVAGHAYAKRNLQLASHFYNQQFGCNFVCACPTTLYGPGMDFHPENSKVMGGLIKKIVDAADSNEQEVVLWGTGKPYREFLHVRDAASLLIDVLEKYDDSSMPLNLGTGQEATIEGLASLIAVIAGFQGKIRFDDSKPDGAYRKRLDCTRMNAILGERDFVSLRDGIEETVAYYRSIR